MTRAMFVLIAVWGACAAGLWAQTSAEQSQQVPLVAVAGCLAQEGSNWMLTHATVPLLGPTPEGQGQASTSVTVERAKQQPLGKDRYRLIGMLREFNVDTHKGHKVLVKGLLVTGAQERRINVVSVRTVDPTCGEKS